MGSGPPMMAYHGTKGAAVSTVIMIILLFMVIFSGITTRYGVNEAVLDISEGRNQYLPPQDMAWFGTDDIGRDIYSRLIFGIRTSLFTDVGTLGVLDDRYSVIRSGPNAGLPNPAIVDELELRASAGGARRDSLPDLRASTSGAPCSASASPSDMPTSGLSAPTVSSYTSPSMP